MLLNLVTLAFTGAVGSIPIRDGPVESSLTDLEHYPRRRSVANIVWSCVAVMIACTWISVHPNVPSVRDHPLEVFRRKFVIMLWALIAPELIVLWAAKQWLCARDIAKKFNKNVYKGYDPKWTKTHGFFLLMGGFAREKLINGQPRIVPISVSDFDAYLDKGILDFPDTTEEEIKDRSKADWLAKSIVIFQTTWFVLQCIARGVDDNLHLTELEVLALAFASLNAAMYFFWWNKPLDVFRPIRLVLKKIPKGDEVPTVRTTERAPMASTPLSFSDVGRKFKQLPIFLFQLPIKMFKTLNRLIGSPNVWPTDERVPTFYVPKVPDDKDFFLLIAIHVLGLGFGAIHFTAWNLIGPTHIELQLWRICSVLITATFVLTLLLLLLAIGAAAVGERHEITGIWDSMAVFMLVLYLIALPLYVIARLMLFGLAIASLRNLTPEAYMEVNWTTYIPHFG